MIYLQLFFAFLQVGLFSVGGGYAAIPLIQGQVVEQHGWLSADTFANLVTIAEMTPGPIAVNAATFTGIHIAGIGGAVIATLGCLFPSLILVTVLAILYQKLKSNPIFQNLLQSLRPVVVALIFSAGLKILLTAVGAETERVDFLSLGLFLGAFSVLRLRKWNPILVMCLCGGVRLLWFTVRSLL